MLQRARVQNCGSLRRQEPSTGDKLSSSLSLFSQSLMVMSRIQQPVRQRGLKKMSINRKSEGLSKCSAPSVTPFLNHSKEREKKRERAISAGFQELHAHSARLIRWHPPQWRGVGTVTHLSILCSCEQYPNHVLSWSNPWAPGPLPWHS